MALTKVRRIHAPWIEALGVPVYLVSGLPAGVKGKTNRTGTEIYVSQEAFDADELTSTVLHEMEHVRQIRKVPVPGVNVVTSGAEYLVGTVRGSLRGAPYELNPLEVSAEQQASRYERRVSAEQAAVRMERRQKQSVGTPPAPGQPGSDFPSPLSEVTAEYASLTVPADDFSMMWVRALSGLYGVDAEFIQRRQRVLRDLMPEGVQDRSDVYLKWWGQLPTSEKVWMVGMPGQPLLRDGMRTTAIVNKDPRVQAFLNDPENARWWYFSKGGSSGRGTKEQLAFARWYGGEWDRILSEGTATQEYLKSPFWAQFRADMVSNLPYALVGGAVKWPADIALERVIYPGLRLAWRGLRAISPGTARLFLRTSEAVGDLMTEQIINRLKALQVPQEIKNAILEKARPFLNSLRQQWAEFSRQKAVHYGNARGTVLGWSRELGLGGDHWLVAERVLAEKRNVWKQWVAVTQERVAGIGDLKAQLAKTTDPAARAVLQQQITVAQGQLKTAANQFRSRLQGITVDAVVRGNAALGLQGMALRNFTPDDAVKVGQLMGKMKQHFDTLYPPGKSGYQPFYYPDPQEAFAGEIARLKELPAVTKWWELESWMSGGSDTAEQAVNKFIYRTAAPGIIQSAEVQRTAYTKFIDDLGSMLTPTMATRLRESLRAAGVDVSDKAVGNIITATMDPLLKFWRNSVLAGRFVPWVTINTIGNLTNSLETLVVKNWMRGRWVNPATFVKGMFDWSQTPLYVQEAFGRTVAQEGGRDVFSRLMAKLYGVNAIIESAFRSGVYRAEFEAVSKELLAKGISRTDIPELAARYGWDEVDRVLYNYGDRYWGAKFLAPVAPFLTYKVENLKFWMREMAENPWLLRGLVQVIQARPEWNIKTEDLINFFEGRLNLPKDNGLVEALYYLRELGIDGRAIDLVTKFNFFDVFGATGRWAQPKWFQDREKVLSADLAQALEKYADNPSGFEAYLKQRPELKTYYDWAQQNVGWKVLDLSLGLIGTNFLADTALQNTTIRRARQFHTIFPQERLFGLLLGKMGQELGIDLASKLAEPTDTQLRAEKQLLKLMGLSTGDEMQDTELARQRWWVRNLTDAALDLGTVSGSLRSDLLDKLYETTKQELGSRAGVNFAPDPERVSRIMIEYGLPDHLWATILAKREQMRDIETATPDDRRARQASFDLLPDELKDLIRTSGDPAISDFWTRVDDAFTRWQRMEPGERRRFLDGNSIESKLVRAMLDTRYTPAERVIVDQVEGRYPADRQNWYATADADQRELFRQIYPRESAIYDSLDKGNVVPVFPQPEAPDTSSMGPTTPYLFRDPKDGEVSVLRPSRVSVSAPPPASGPEAKQPPMFTATLAAGTYSVEQVARAISGVETSGAADAYSRVSYVANPGKGHALGKYQMLPETLISLGYGKYLDSANPADFMDPERAKQLAQRFLADPKIQDQAMTDLITANAKSLGFGAGPYTQEQVGYLALAHVGGINLVKRVQADPSLANRRTVGPNTSQTVAQYRDSVENNVAFQPPAGQTTGRGRVTPVPKPDTTLPQSAAEWYARRKVNVAEGGLLIDYPGGLLQVMKSYIKRINPDLADKDAQRIVDTIYTLYVDGKSAGVPLATRGFDPLWVLAIIAERTGFDPDYDKGRNKGVMGLDIGKFPSLTDETVFDIAKNINEGMKVFIDVQRAYGTEEAVRRFGVDPKKIEVKATAIIGLRPVKVSPIEPGTREFRLLSSADTEREHRYADFRAKLDWAGGNPQDPDYLIKRQREWAALGQKSEPWMWDVLKDHNPDLYWAVKEATDGVTYWFQGKFVIEQTTPERAAWKHRIRAAATMEDAVQVYRTGSGADQEWFAYNNPDMALFFADYLGGVSRDYKNYEFSDDQDAEQYIPARRKLALALATGDVKRIKQAVSEITSIYGDDVAGFTRKLKDDTPTLFEAARPYLMADTVALSPDDKLKVRQYLQAINHQLEEHRRTGNTEALQIASAMWNNPENAGFKALVFDHETDHYDNIERRLAGRPPVAHYVADSDYVTFQRFAQSLQTAFNGRNMEQMRAMWQAAPESFRREFQAYHASYYDYEAILNGEEPVAWVEQRERQLAAPYKNYVTMADAYGAYSPLKLAQVLQESPAAFNYLIADPEFRQNFRAAQEGKVAGLYAGVLRQYNYSPALLNAIPDDGTRFMLSVMDPNIADALKRYNITATQRERPVIPGIGTLFAGNEEVTVEPVLEDGQPTGNFRIRRTPMNETGPFSGNVQDIIVSAQQLQNEYAALLGMQTTAPEFQGIKAQYERNSAVVQGLGLVYQGIQIGQQGGTFIEQLPAYYGAAQAAAAGGLFTGPAAGFLLGPAGLLIGGLLGLFGGIFGANRQQQEQEERLRRQQEAERRQAIDQADQLRARIRDLTAEQVQKLAGQQVQQFLDRPSAITRQALFDALVVPKPNW